MEKLLKPKSIFSFSLLTLAIFAPSAYAADTVGMSLARANEAAGVQTIETAVYNPAGLVLFKHPEVSASAIYGQDKIHFSGTSTTDGVYTENGSAGTRASGTLPAVFASYPLTDRIVSSIAVYSPFSGDITFPDDSIVRYQTTKLSLTTINVTPSFGFALTPKWSLGLGLDAVKAITTDANKDFVGGTPPSSDYTSQQFGTAWGYGWHGGLLYQLSTQTRFGFSYNSKITEKFKGNSKVWDNNDILLQESNTFGAHYTLPATYRLGTYHQFNNRWQGMAQLHYVTWGVQRTITSTGIVDGEGGLQTEYDNPNFRNTWGVEVGANYIINDQWLLRGGLGIDQSPVRKSNDQPLSAQGGTAEAVAAGVHYQATKAVGLDAGYTHLFIGTVNTNNTDTSTNNTLTGKITNNVNAAGLQVTWSFA